MEAQMRARLGAFVAALAIVGMMGGATMAGSVADLQWQNRVLILFGTDGDAVRRQVSELLARRDGLEERDMRVFAVIDDRLEPIHGPVPDAEDAATLRARFAIDPQAAFTAVLIGKDGGEKWRQEQVTPPAEIEAVIDAMPMRRAGD
jgi:hypothetical protein